MNTSNSYLSGELVTTLRTLEFSHAFVTSYMNTELLDG